MVRSCHCAEIELTLPEARTWQGILTRPCGPRASARDRARHGLSWNRLWDRWTNTSCERESSKSHVVVLDKDGNLIGATSQGSFDEEGLAPDEETQLRSLLSKLPPEALQKVASYQAIFDEAEEQT